MEQVKIADSKFIEIVADEPDPKLMDNALRVLQKRYLKKDDKGRVIETPKELFARVAWNLAQAERNYGASEAQVEETARRFYRIIANLEFLPNSPTLMNAGLDLQQLSACFVLPVDDSLAGIFHTLQEAALIHQSGGGTGFSFSHLRPKNDFVRSTMGVASGPVSFMKVYDAATQQVKQGSKRRGANMGILRVDHPDILDFITCKNRTSEITNFNISVAVTDTFWEAVRAGTKYDLINPRTKQVVGQLDAREVLNKIAFQAWKNGEPGLFFIDENNRRQPTPNVGDMEATNPCVTGDTLISTELGLIPIAELAERYPDGGISLVTDRRVAAEVITESNGLLLASRDQAEGGTRLGPLVAAWRTGVKPVWRIATKSGFELTATADHKVLTTVGWLKVEDMVPGIHKLFIQSGEGSFSEDPRLPFTPANLYVGANGKTTVLHLPTGWSRELGLALGWLIGDGWLRSGDKNCRVGFTFAKNDAPVFAILRSFLNRWYGRNIRGVKR